MLGIAHAVLLQFFIDSINEIELGIAKTGNLLPEDVYDQEMNQAWVRCSHRELADRFPYIGDTRTIYRVLKELQELRLIYAEIRSTKWGERTLYYTCFLPTISTFVTLCGDWLRDKKAAIEDWNDSTAWVEIKFGDQE
jgi:hypothetical protein